MQVNGKEVDFTFDTGADVSTLTVETSKKLGLSLREPDRYLSGADGSKLAVTGVGDVHIKSTYNAVDTSVYVLDGARQNLLGISELKQLNLLAVINAMCLNEFDPTREFPKVFEGLGTMPGKFSINLKRDIEPVRLNSPRPIAAGLREKAKTEIDKMLADNVIEPVEEPTDWCSGLTIAPKKSGKIRMCVDLTNLNKCVKREVYPLPRISDMLSDLKEGVMFSKLDANSGFWQVKLDPKSKLLTTFVTPWGRFCFKRMPFGISSAPEYFQRAMEKILKGLDGVICLMDDILVYGKNANEHWYRLSKVLKRIEKSGVTLSKEKCEFGTSEVKFLGHVVSSVGIKPDPDKIKAIVDMKPPSTKTEARRFTGMVNYLMKFSSKLAELCSPIHEVTGNKSEWFWGPVQQDAFEQVKQEISDTPVLCTFDLNASHRVSADASKYAIGAVLLQNNGDDEWQPVEYASRKLTDTETRYAIIEKEALGITWACEKFDYYLVGRKFEIESDHKPLIALLGEKDLSCLPARVQRFKLRLMRYDYDIFHTPGKNMLLADALSRPNSGECDEESIRKCNDVEAYVQSIICSSRYCDSKEEKIREAMSKDPVALQCFRYMHDGWPKHPDSLDKDLLKLYTIHDRLSIYNGLLLYDARIYIPECLREKYLELCHEGHQGITKCRRRAQRHFWWPGVSSDIATYISRCNVCIMHGNVKHQPMHESVLPSIPWEVIGSDVFTFDGELYLVMIDYYTKWIEAVPIVAQTSRAVINAIKAIFSCFGIPNVIRSDNGRCYDSNEFREFAEESGFISVTSSPRYPCSNGLAESAVKTVKSLWKKCKDKGTALAAYRTTPLSSGYSPSELMFGRPTRSNLGIQYESDIDYGQFEDNETARRRKIKRRWDKKYRAAKLPKLLPGQHVYVKAPTDVGKAGVVLREDKSPDSYWVSVDQSEIRRNRKHLFLLHYDLDVANDEDLELCPHAKRTCNAGENLSDSDNSKALELNNDDVLGTDDHVVIMPDIDHEEVTPTDSSISVSGDQTPNDNVTLEHEEATPSNHSSNASNASKTSCGRFVPVDEKVIHTSSARVVKPPDRSGYVYYK